MGKLGIEEYNRLMHEQKQELRWRDEWLDLAHDKNSSEEQQQFAWLGVFGCQGRIDAIEDKILEDVYGNKTR